MKLRYHKKDPMVPCTDPIVGHKYHLFWARSRGMVWVLKEIKGETAIMETPKTKKILTASVKDLMLTRKDQTKK